MSIFRRPRVNFQIRVPQVLVIDESGLKLGVLNTQEAIRMAQEKGLSLVEIVPNPPGGGPPITKIMDFGKWLYEKQKAEKKKMKGAKTELKTVRLGLNTDTHDLGVKAKKADEFLKEGNKVQVELRLKGRQITMKDLGKQKIRQFLEFVKEPFEPESQIKIQGRNLNIIIKKQK
ncbi:MAG: translation initiation factor IF-3 [Patescibacteria group bacterium]